MRQRKKTWARLALIVNTRRCVAEEKSTEDVDAESVAAAWALVNYFKSHARKVPAFT